MLSTDSQSGYITFLSQLAKNYNEAFMMGERKATPHHATRRSTILRLFGWLSLFTMLSLSSVKGQIEKFYKDFPLYSRGEMKKRWAMVVDLRRCTGCYACQVTCKVEFGVPFEGFRTWLETYEYGLYPEVKRLFLPRMCNHCDNPPCVPVCPVQAIYKRDDGIVQIDQLKCIGCGYCAEACPYGAIYKNNATNTYDKCTFCEHRLAQGLLPACVSNCFGKAMYFGDLADPNSIVSRLISENKVQLLKPYLGTEPMVYYIGLDETLITGVSARVKVISPRTGVKEVSAI